MSEKKAAALELLKTSDSHTVRIAVLCELITDS